MESLVNWDQLDMIADGYTEDFVEIYREFELDLPRILGEVEAGVMAGDATAAARAAHQAKGSAANFGFVAFTTLMAEIESGVKAGSLAGAAETLAQAKTVFADSVAAVRVERKM